MKKRMILIAMAGLVLLCLLIAGGAGAAPAVIDSDSFPDPVFRDYVSFEFDTDSDGTLTDEEIDSVSGIWLYQTEAESLQGISVFRNLTQISAWSNHITGVLDLSGNPLLQYVDVNDNQITQLILPAGSVTDLNCSRNMISDLDVSGLPGLINLWCCDNNLTDLDVSVCENLEILLCSRNPLSSLAVSNHPALTLLRFDECRLTGIDLSGCRNITDFEGWGNQYTVDFPIDYAALPGNFDYSRTGNWTNAWLDGSLINITNESLPVTYDYDCGNGISVRFSLVSSSIPFFQLTDGEPVSEERAIAFSTANELPESCGDAVIHSYTYQELDNGFLRFTMDYTVPEGLNIYIFDPPNGDLISMWGSGTTSPGRDTLRFDIPADDLLSAEGLNVNFYNESGNCFVFFSSDMPGSREMFELTSGIPCGAEHDIDYMFTDELPDGYDPAFIHSYTYQELDNGCLRFAMDCTMPEGLSVFVFDPPNGDLIGMWGSGTTSPDRSTIRFDIPADDLQSVEGLTVNFYDENGSYFIFFSADSLFPQSSGVFEFNLTNGAPSGPAESFGFDFGRLNVTPDMIGTIHSCTAQGLDNGYTRITVQFTVPGGLWLSATDRPALRQLFSDPSVMTSAQLSVLQFDISNEDLAATSAVNIIFNYGPGSPRQGYAFVLMICPHAYTPDPSQAVIVMHPTDGTPDGDMEDIRVYEVNHWDAKIYNGKRQHLDNGHTRFTFRISVPAGCYIRVTREQMLFDYYTANVGTSAANTALQVDIPDSALEGLEVFSVHFYRGNIYYLNADIQCNDQSDRYDLNSMNVLRLPDSLTAIGDEAFEGLACEAVIIPDGCLSVGSHAFRNCVNLKYVRIPCNADIVSDAFEGCRVILFERVGSN